jgi:transcriptional regulator of arginine metabolism
VKPQRQQALMELVRKVPLASQHEIRDHLAAMGHHATQSTISRDLEELGLVRVRDGNGKPRYAAPAEARAAGVHARFRAVLAEFAIAIEPSGNLVLIRTTPGAAQAVGEAMDRAGVEGVLGTVAGDDTLLVVASESVRGRAVAKRLRELGGLG